MKKTIKLTLFAKDYIISFSSEAEQAFKQGISKIARNDRFVDPKELINAYVDRISRAHQQTQALSALCQRIDERLAMSERKMVFDSKNTDLSTPLSLNLKKDPKDSLSPEQKGNEAKTQAEQSSKAHQSLFEGQGIGVFLEQKQKAQEENDTQSQDKDEQETKELSTSVENPQQTQKQSIWKSAFEKLTAFSSDKQKASPDKEQSKANLNDEQNQSEQENKSKPATKDELSKQETSDTLNQATNEDNPAQDLDTLSKQSDEQVKNANSDASEESPKNESPALFLPDFTPIKKNEPNPHQSLDKNSKKAVSQIDLLGKFGTPELMSLGHKGINAWQGEGATLQGFECVANTPLCVLAGGTSSIDMQSYIDQIANTKAKLPSNDPNNRLLKNVVSRLNE